MSPVTSGAPRQRQSRPGHDQLRGLLRQPAMTSTRRASRTSTWVALPTHTRPSISSPISAPTAGCWPAPSPRSSNAAAAKVAGDRCARLAARRSPPTGSATAV